MPQTSAIGSSYIVNSYVGDSLLATATGSWYTLLQQEKVSDYNRQGNWFWDATDSLQDYYSSQSTTTDSNNNDTLTLKCSAYRNLSGSDSTI